MHVQPTRNALTDDAVIAVENNDMDSYVDALLASTEAEEDDVVAVYEVLRGRGRPERMRVSFLDSDSPKQFASS